MQIDFERQVEEARIDVTHLRSETDKGERFLEHLYDEEGNAIFPRIFVVLAILQTRKTGGRNCFLFRL